MIIGRTENGIVTITPDEGMAVTNGFAISDTIVYLGKNDSPDNWWDCEKEAEEADR